MFTLGAIAVTAFKTLSTSQLVALFAAAGFADTLVAGGSFDQALKNGIISGVSAGAFSAAGAATNFNTFGDGVLRVGSFGAVGGIASVMAGGKFGHGFVSAGLGAATPLVPGTQDPANGIRRTVVASIVGGTSSRISGGKFANGASTAAFAALVSEVASRGNSGGGCGDWTQTCVGEDGLTYTMGDGSFTDSNGNPMVAWGWGDPINPNVVDAVAGFGDTFGASYIRNALGVDGGINYDSGYYLGGQAIGTVTPGFGTAATLRGAAYLGRSYKWLNQGRYWRIGPSTISRSVGGTKPFSYGAGRDIPMLRIGNKPPNAINHIDLRVLGR